jgi:GR25 family glycosyltransferase involved in LPS biosynthesis
LAWGYKENFKRGVTLLKITSLPTFFINLDEETERRKSMERLLRKYGFSNVERFPAQKAGKRVGCSMSHAALLEEIVKKNIYPCIVLEDDLEVFNFRSIIHVPEKYDAMYLGISKYGYNKEKDDPHKRSLKIKEKNKYYHRVQNMLARHAIIRNSAEYDQESIDMMKQFISDPETYIAGDVTLSSLHPNYMVYSLNTPIFYQNQPGVRSLTNLGIEDCSFVEMDKL